jgi:hypothetical protein
MFVMNVNVLIDAVVRQTMVLIAQLATAAGVRAPLAHVANQVFLDLTHELKEQGLGNKVIADMFGLALRSYHSKVQRLSESSTFRGRSLWEAILDWIQKNGTVDQADVLSRFARDDEATVRGVLTDLVDSRLVFRTGRAGQTSYRAATAAERPSLLREEHGESLAQLVWVVIHRRGSASANELAEALAVDRTVVQGALDRLVRERRVARVESGDAVTYRSEECVIPLGEPAGWEAAVLDHYHAVVTAICAKLSLGEAQSGAEDTVGGSTYGFTLWRGHPHEREVLGWLGRMRAEMSALRERVNAYNSAHRREQTETFGVLAYVGQTTTGREGPGDET